MFIGLSTWMFIWSQMACSSSRLVETVFPSLDDLILYDDVPSLVKRRCMMMLLPYSLGLYASSPWFLSCTETSATLYRMVNTEHGAREVKTLTFGPHE